MGEIENKGIKEVLLQSRHARQLAEHATETQQPNRLETSSFSSETSPGKIRPAIRASRVMEGDSSEEEEEEEEEEANTTGELLDASNRDVDGLMDESEELASELVNKILK